MIPHNLPSLDSLESQKLKKVISSRWLAQGKETEYFENEICNFLNIPDGHAVAVSSGTAALYLSLLFLKKQKKNMPIPVYLCSAVKNAVHLAGSYEKLIDTDTEYPNISYKTISNKFSIIPHMFGIPNDLQKFKGNNYIEDCAQSLGAKVSEKFCGTIGLCGVFSFYATKMITTGQGGMVVSNNKDLINAIKDYREFDCRKDKKYRFNFQMTDLQASIGRVQLKKLP